MKMIGKGRPTNHPSSAYFTLPSDGFVALNIFVLLEGKFVFDGAIHTAIGIPKRRK
jgi:hypothetical protein